MTPQPVTEQPDPPQTGGEGNIPQPFRGPLKYEIETSSPQLEAGRKASVFIRITNPYDIPVRVMSAHTEVPVEFQEVTPQPHWITRMLSKADAIEDAIKDKKQYISATSLSTGDSPAGDAAAEGDKGPSAPPAPVTLQPGNSTLYEFKLRTRHWLFFNPTTYNLNVQVQYEMKGIENHDTVKYQLSIRAPIKAQIYGSIIGSIIGTILHSNHVWEGTVNHLFDNKFPYVQLIVPVRFMASALLAAVLVIAFARKKDTQPFITIEDFWGGFFIGFLAGFVGKSLLNQYLPQA